MILQLLWIFVSKPRNWNSAYKLLKSWCYILQSQIDQSVWGKVKQRKPKVKHCRFHNFVSSTHNSSQSC